jgi:NADPH-dependent 2,4-dienoyl-CoA reductase/sulfur reductase-like enzyme
LISNQVVAIDNLELKLDNEDKIQSDLILLSTGASLPDWLARSDLEKTENFIAINDHLQSLNFKNMYLLAVMRLPFKI